MIDKPSYMCTAPVYINAGHMLNQDVVEFLVNNQDHYAVHTAKGYEGYVFALTEESGDKAYARWYEEVWARFRHRATYRAEELPDLINFVVEEFGYA